ncbi:MAG: AlkA N-terminal domain-containing protein [Rhodoferax sp.]
MHANAPVLHDDARYLALKARDARFDGRFFTGVTSTGIYCRPVCKVRTPRRENCRFFALAAQAERAGFRPCLRCRPELAPRPGWMDGTPWSAQDAGSILAREAAKWLDTQLGVDGEAHATDAQAMSRRLGVSERHLRRVFEAQWGVSPLQYLQTRRLLTAKQLLTDTVLSMVQVAQFSGFSSVRRFNAAFLAHYRLAPTALRKVSKTASPGSNAEAALQLKLSYRPPYDAAAMLGFIAQRAAAGVEWVDMPALSLARTLSLVSAGTTLQGWVHCRFDPTRNTVHLQLSPGLTPALPQVVEKVRAWLDLDADPMAINAVLGGHFAGLEGLRVPGAVDGFELAVRAVLGQQVTVAAGRTFAQRLVVRWGASVPTPWPELNTAFPTPKALAGALPSELGALGIVRQRQQAILALAQAVNQGDLVLSPGADVGRTLAQLQALPGIGAWTAQYIAMRALRWPDALPAQDVALHKAMGVQQSKSPARELERVFAAWSPWRSYAVVRAWHTLSQPGEPPP